MVFLVLFLIVVGSFGSVIGESWLPWPFKLRPTTETNTHHDGDGNSDGDVDGDGGSGDGDGSRDGSGDGGSDGSGDGSGDGSEASEDCVYYLGSCKCDFFKYVCISSPHMALTWQSSVFYAAFSAFFIVLLYFLYSYLVYLIYALFIISATWGVNMCLRGFIYIFEQFVGKDVPLGHECVSKYCGKVYVLDIVVLFLSLSLPIVWVVERHSKTIWILQDILASCIIFCIFKTLQIRSLKVATVLLGLFFLYDIFFVFITPFFTHGKSVMEAVATGSNAQPVLPTTSNTSSPFIVSQITGKHTTSPEVLPLSLIIPHLSDVRTTCARVTTEFSLLGLGDVIMPGLFIAFCLFADCELGREKTPFYFVISLLSYCVGFGLTYLALILMHTGQPALLYLVPCVLISVMVTSLVKGEFVVLWTGTFPVHRNLDLLTDSLQHDVEKKEDDTLLLLEIDSRSLRDDGGRDDGVKS
eukprot:TRINITY_DN7925_c0_g1_i1.p1 TRINITY_DN7925_c0_g1~~TRINITY_DN7925_c0_g1_i1.p1  ORF type:complete len:469 (-),score=93.98 TRINITY_DN7925_c0_g1_i1:214-1620(-)